MHLTHQRRKEQLDGKPFDGDKGGADFGCCFRIEVEIEASWNSGQASCPGLSNYLAIGIKLIDVVVSNTMLACRLDVLEERDNGRAVSHISTIYPCVMLLNL